MSRFDFALMSLALLVMGIATGLWIAGQDHFMIALLVAVGLATWFEIRALKRRERVNG